MGQNFDSKVRISRTWIEKQFQIWNWDDLHFRWLKTDTLDHVTGTTQWTLPYSKWSLRTSLWNNFLPSGSHEHIFLESRQKELTLAEYNTLKVNGIINALWTLFFHFDWFDTISNLKGDPWCQKYFSAFQKWHFYFGILFFRGQRKVVTYILATLSVSILRISS